MGLRGLALQQRMRSKEFFKVHLISCLFCLCMPTIRNLTGRTNVQHVVKGLGHENKHVPGTQVQILIGDQMAQYKNFYATIRHAVSPNKEM